MTRHIPALARDVLAVVFMTVVLPVQGGTLPDFADLVDDEYRAVVNISTSRSVDPREGALPPGFSMPEEDESRFGDLLERFFGEGQGPPRPDDSASLGSGLIISRDGYILTNNHVVEDADEIIVRMHDRRQFVAELVGMDQRSDIALLRVDADDLPTVRIGDPGTLRVGEWVLAIGSPFGFDHSVTAGIVSAKGRSLPNDNYVPFIQTDVAINPGNSGGPLFNLDGEVVGVNAQIFSRTGGFMGLSFAIPIDVAIDVADQLRTEGRVVRGWLGVVIQDVTRELAESFDMERARGALVARVLADSPAEEAGVRTGDIIVAYRDREVSRSSALPPMVGRTPVGEVAEVEIIREGEHMSLGVEIGELPARDEQAGPGREPDDDEPGEGDRDPLGLSVEPVPDEDRRRLDIDQGGVRVADVEPGPAADAGIRSGDVLTMMNSVPIEGVEDFRDRLAELERGETVAVLVQRMDGPQFIAIRLPEEEH